jgi:hypothetical protein
MYLSACSIINRQISTCYYYRDTAIQLTLVA